MKRLSVILKLVFVCLSGCIDPYTPPPIEPGRNPLVVEGAIDGNTGIANVRLTTTAPLSQGLPAPAVVGAVVTVESGSGNLYSLFDAGGTGNYSRSGIPVSPGELFRVRIQAGGESFVSDFAEALLSPPIDSVTLDIGSDGIQVYINTHDPANEIGNYLWTYEETWAYTAAFESTVNYVSGSVVLRSPDEYIYTCYSSEVSSTINNISSEKLTENRISKYPLLFLPATSDKIRVRYSILVRQFSIGREEHTFWTEMKKNSQNLGTLFDPLPTQVIGNIHNETDPAETALGYFRVGFSQEQRVFIDNIKLPAGYHTPRDYGECEEKMWPIEQFSVFSVYTNTYLLTRPVYEGIFLIGYNYAPYSCVDCQLQGGTLTKPDFW